MTTNGASASTAGAGAGQPGALLARLLAAPASQRRAILDQAGGASLLTALGDEAERLVSREVRQAIAAGELLAALADETGTPRDRARARRALGLALAYAGELDRSLRTHAEARAMASAAFETVEAARAMLASLHALAKLGRFEQAVRAGEQARAELFAAGEPALAARADINLANVHKNLGDARAALRHLESARAIVASEPALLGPIDNSRGESLLLLDDFSAAEEAFAQALSLYRANGAGFLQALVEGNLADLYARQGRLQEAMEHFESARRRFEQDSAAGHLARLIVEQAEALEAMGLPQEALAAFDEALPRLVEAGLAFEVARGSLGRAKALLRLRRFAEAEAQLDEASQTFARLGQLIAEARVDLLRAELWLEGGRADEAERLLSAALSRLAERPLAAATARHHLARIAHLRGRHAEAEALLGAAIETAERLEAPTLLADLLHARGRSRRSAGNLAAAIADFRRAIASVERVRGSFQAERLRAAFLGDRVQVYQDLVRTILDRGGAEAAAEGFAVAEQAKSRSLLDVVRGAIELAARRLGEAGEPAEGGTTSEAPEDAQRRRLAQELARLRSELNALYSRLGSEGAEDQRRLGDASWQAAVRERERRLEQLETRLAATERSWPLPPSPVQAEQVGAALPPDAVLIEYFMAGDELVAWALRPHSAQGEKDGVLIRRLAPRRAVEELVARFQFQVGRSLRPHDADPARAARLERDLCASLRALHEVVLAPLADRLEGARRAIFVPHGPLHTVPFAALHDGAGYLIERLECSVAPSAGVWLHAHAGEPEQRFPHATGAASAEGPGPRGAGEVAHDPRAALVVGVGDEHAPRIAEEAALVASRLTGARLLLGEEATVEAVLDALPQAGAVHLACHGRFSSLAPLASGLRLADRWLTVRDLQRRRLRASLVTLSGCDTGRSLVSGGDEVLGLLRGFLAAGARSLVVSLWTVNDTSTAELMNEFYRVLLSRPEGAPPRAGAALRQAQQALLARRSSPLHWAPFTMVGRT